MTVIVRVFRRHPRWYTAAAVLVLAAVAVTVWLVVRATATPEPELATARTGMLDRTVVVTGTIEPSQRADLDFPAGGRVESVSVVVGQQVTAGQELAAVDAASLPGQVAQARSALASAEARLAADRDADASSAQIDADEAAVDSARAQLQVALQNAAEATLTAPFAGTVAAVNVTVGEQVGGGSAAAGLGGGGSEAPGGAAAGGSGAAAAVAAAAAGGTGSGGGTAAVVVVSTGSYVVEATVDDTQVGRLAVGQQANITPNGAAEPLPGTVASVALVATSTSGVAGYPVTITVAGSPPNLYIGSSAEVEIVTERITDAVLVPSAAVRGAGADAVVTVVEQGEQVDRPVTVGVTAAGRTQILSGLTSGEDVVVPTVEPVAPSGGFGPPGGGSGGPGGGEPEPTGEPGAEDGSGGGS